MLIKSLINVGFYELYSSVTQAWAIQFAFVYLDIYFFQLAEKAFL